MTERLSLPEIRAFWTRQAVTHGQSPAASWSDQQAIELEIAATSGWLADGDRVLDVGCGNGYSTVRFAAKRPIHIKGVDYVAEMIEIARQRLQGSDNNLVGRVSFEVGDITDLDEPTDTYDKVVVIRVIINLHDWHHQLRGLREAVRVLKPGGTFLLSEATLQGWRRLNEFRAEWGLPDIDMPPFNSYVDTEQVVLALHDQADLVCINDFASSYYVGTRVIKPLLAAASGANIDVARPDLHWNRWFAAVPAWGDYGVQKLFVFRKREPT